MKLLAWHKDIGGFWIFLASKATATLLGHWQCLLAAILISAMRMRKKTEPQPMVNIKAHCSSGSNKYHYFRMALCWFTYTVLQVRLLDFSTQVLKLKWKAALIDEVVDDWRSSVVSSSDLSADDGEFQSLISSLRSVHTFGL